MLKKICYVFAYAVDVFAEVAVVVVEVLVLVELVDVEDVLLVVVSEVVL